jgi:hypothetical protein
MIVAGKHEKRKFVYMKPKGSKKTVLGYIIPYFINENKNRLHSWYRKAD